MTGLSTTEPSSVVSTCAGEAEHVPHRAVHLRRAAQAVGVLHRVPAVPVAGQQRRPGQQRAQVGRADQLARMRPDHLDPLVVGPVGAEQRLDRQRAGHVGRLDQHRGVVHREREQRLHRFGPVDQGQAFLGRQRQRLDARARASTSAAGRPAGGSPGPRSRPSPISGCARCASWARSPEAPTEPLPGIDRQQAEVEQLEQPRRAAPTRTPGVAGGERPGPQQQHRPHRRVVQRHAGGRPRASARSRPAAWSGRPRPPGVSASAPNPVFTPYTGASPRERVHHDRTARLHPLRHVRRPARPGPARGHRRRHPRTVSALPSTTTSRMTDSFPRPGRPAAGRRGPGPKRAGQALGPAGVTRTLRRRCPGRAALDPAELEQPGGDGGGQRAVQVPAALGPVDAGAGEATPGAPYFSDIQAERAQRPPLRPR